MSDQFSRLQKELAELVSRHTDKDGYWPTIIPQLGFSRYSASHYSTWSGSPYGRYNPSIGIVVQGTKKTFFWAMSASRMAHPNTLLPPWIGPLSWNRPMHLPKLPIYFAGLRLRPT
ncbi:hypothetical protein OMP40_18605 [Cohnella rhizosphaerae]|uniref:Uncharacterized protein n=1 Tax=Cohnella rhizosphaerae TaxID=1457232 RepID=A0A9X4QV44_9BACL|nr:hypothetical protein [Cohnella rhizosphaerae]MDG0811152.1 hypothetical protein [Cohnella rhizosphaerae]